MPKTTPWFLGALAALAFACGGSQPPATPPDGGEPPAGSDAGTPIPGPTVTAKDSVGAFLPAPTRTILAGADVALFGTQGTVYDPDWFGLDPSAPSLRPGLVALDTHTGKVRIYTSADGLPESSYVSPFHDYGLATASVLSLAWVEKDHAFAAAATDFVVKGSIDAHGTLTFASTRLRAPGASADAVVAHVAASGGEIFAGTDQGVAVLDPATLSVRRWLSFGVSMEGPWIADLSSGSVDGHDAVGIVFGPAGAAPTSVALAHPGEAAAQVFTFADGSTPLSALGMQGRVLVGAVGSDGRGFIGAVGPGDSGLSLDVMVPADSLAMSTQGDLHPGVMAWDAMRERLIVGGRLSASGGGGMIELQGMPDGTITSSAEDFIASNDPYVSLLPKQADALTFDDAGRLYVVGRQQCNEHKLKQLPVVRIERDDLGAARVVRPYVSGIRDLRQDPVNHDTWLAVRDGDAGLTCEGLPVAQSLCRLRADGACEIVPVQANDGSNILVNPGVSEVAFGNADRKELALATLDEATWVREGDTARELSTQFDPRLSLDLTSAAFGPDGSLWLGSRADWQGYPDLDENAVNARSPHGLGLLTLGEDGAPTATRRYVRLRSDNTDIDEVAGLPSDTVWSVMPLAGTRRALVALGIDRSVSTYDHQLGEVSPKNVRGGIALVEDAQVTAFAAPANAAFSDVVALAQGPSSSVFALDAVLGVLAVDVPGKKATVWMKAPWSPSERPLSLAVDGAGRLAIGTTGSLYLIGADQGVTRVLDRGSMGFVWRVRFLSDGVLYAGADQGLVRVAIGAATLPAALGPASFPARDLWPLPPPCGGIDGCKCSQTLPCADGYDCACSKDTGCACAPQDPCAANPGAANCACVADKSTCQSGLQCECNYNGCSCQLDPATCANGACSCRENLDCPTAWYCNPSRVCAAKSACDADCSCATANGCDPGMICRSGIGGQTCE